MKDREKCCENCCYCINGRCHRYPPYVVTGDDHRSYSVWPYVEKFELCGEFKETIYYVYRIPQEKKSDIKDFENEV